MRALLEAVPDTGFLPRIILDVARSSRFLPCARGLVITAILATISLRADAVTLRPASIQELTAHARQVIRATCLSSEVRTHPEKSRSYVYTTFRVDEVLVGSAPETVVLRVINLGETFAQSVGVPVFRPGDQGVLFLTPPNEDGFPFLVGLGMGCFHLRGTRALQHVPVSGGAAAPAGASGLALPRTYLPSTDLAHLRSAILGAAPSSSGPGAGPPAP